MKEKEIEQVSSGARIEMGDAVEVNGQDITLATDGGAGLVLSGSNALLTGSETKIHGGSIALNGSPAPATTHIRPPPAHDLIASSINLAHSVAPPPLASSSGMPVEPLPHGFECIDSTCLRTPDSLHNSINTLTIDGRLWYAD